MDRGFVAAPVVLLACFVATRTAFPLCGPDQSQSRVLFANERLRVLDWRLQPGQSANATNAGPTVRWQILGDGDPVPEPRFYEAGTCVTVSHPPGSAEERREFVFEVLQAQPKYTEAQVAELLRAPAYPTGVGSKMFFENHLVRMWDFHSAGKNTGMDEFHQHVLDYAFVVIGNGSALNLYHPNASLANGTQYDDTFGFADGHVSWEAIDNGGFEPGGATPIMPGCLHSVDVQGIGRRFREYLIELK
eukprot:g8051.t1